VYWIAAIALAAFTGHAIAGAVRDAESARQQWGTDRGVLVARRRLAIGDTIDAAAIERRSWPEAVVPDSAVRDDVDVVGRTVVAAIEPGEALTTGRLAPDGLHGVAALVPLGWRALALPVGPATVPLSVGDRVDLVAAVDPTARSSSNSPAFTVAERAWVVAIDERSITVAVPARDAPAVAFAITTGAVVPVLRSA
jgi:Flp pilus assembly protein CpaB